MKKLSMMLIMFASACRANPYPVEFLNVIQYSDIAGIGTIEALSNTVMTVKVDHYWLGSSDTNILSVNNSGEWNPQLKPPAFSGDMPTYEQDRRPAMLGKVVVFFALTNEWKSSSLPLRSLTEFDWNLVQSFTNAGPSCPPKFYDLYCAPWFTIETNDIEHATFLSNITQCIFFSRDRQQFYRELRNVLKPDLSCSPVYKAMTFMPMTDLLWDSDETNLVEALNDPLLAPRFRYDALWTLQKRFCWSETNTVPEL